MFSNVIRLIFFLAVVSCSSNDKTETNTFSSDIALYKSGMTSLKKKEFSEAVEQFTQLEIQYPYSEWATKGQLMLIKIILIRKLSLRAATKKICMFF